MGSFLGTYEHNLDSKNRFFVPVKFRELLGDGFVVRVKLSRYPHIDCFTQEDFEETVEREISQGAPNADVEELNARARAYSAYVTVDAHGRICIPAKILKKAKIEKESVFCGMGKYFQIWNSEINDAYYDQLEEKAIKEEEARDAQDLKRFEFMAQGRFLETKN